MQIAVLLRRRQFGSGSAISAAQRALLALVPSLRLKTVRCELPAQPGWTAYAAGQFGGLLDCGHPLPGVDLASGPYHKLNCAEALP